MATDKDIRATSARDDFDELHSISHRAQAMARIRSNWSSVNPGSAVQAPEIAWYFIDSSAEIDQLASPLAADSVHTA